MSDIYKIGSQVGNPKQLMPPGFSLWRVEDHYIWIDDDTETESAIHWNRWAIYRGAWEYYRTKVQR